MFPHTFHPSFGHIRGRTLASEDVSVPKQQEAILNFPDALAAVSSTANVAGRAWASTCGSYSLQRLLDSQDAVLGAAVPGRDPLLDVLHSFVGTPGSPPVRPWEQGLPNQTDPASQLTGQLHSSLH